MKKLGYIIGLFMIINLVSGCSTAEFFRTEKDELLFSEIASLYDQIDEEEWDGVLSDVNKLHDNYKQRKWKLLMLGNMDQFHDLEIELELLKEKVEDEDDVESKSALREINYRLYTIYNL